ncbi:7106_t:CDS:1 [Ambispora gerdemannii]|uniref:7106_t:CDS:1 n=1 Tax=Ambispora gerdemannii TaxID=144530 RepID=A0A9N9GCP4_9GLOM|nr:7106_t:CDS:1 [Ambispora gerdemannii]
MDATLFMPLLVAITIIYGVLHSYQELNNINDKTIQTVLRHVEERAEMKSCGFSWQSTTSNTSKLGSGDVLNGSSYFLANWRSGSNRKIIRFIYGVNTRSLWLLKLKSGLHHKIAATRTSYNGNHLAQS